MYSHFSLVTNNELVEEWGYPLIRVDGSIEQVLQKVLEMTLQGHRLLSHPLSGSVKPAINPYKTIIISTRPETANYQEIEMVQTCLEKVREMRRHRSLITWGEQVDSDLKFLDGELVKSGIQSLANVI